MFTIAITDIAGLRIGQVEDEQAATGATVLLSEDGMAASIDVRGGGPASRDTRILDPLAAAQQIHAVLLTGGSAYGLDAAGGVMRYLEEHGIGLPVGDCIVPLVCQSAIFDLGVGTSKRPDAQMAYDACVAAEAGNYRDGCFGAGCGASVGKALGMEFAMKSGIGSHAVQSGELQVGAIVVVNAVGDIVDPATGRTIAGLLDEQRSGLRSFRAAMVDLWEAGAQADSHVGANTAIGAIVTNARLQKASLAKVAGMAHNGLARAISPVHTSMDGDSIYALSVGELDAPTDVVGILAAECMAQAVLCAAHSAHSSHGLPAASELKG